MPISDRVTVRLTAEQISLMQSLVDDGEYETMTDVIRKAIDEFMAKRFTPDNIEKITIDFPKDSVNRLETLINDGDSVSLDDAIRNAVREYTKIRLNQ